MWSRFRPIFQVFNADVTIVAGAGWEGGQVCGGDHVDADGGGPRRGLSHIYPCSIISPGGIILSSVSDPHSFYVHRSGSSLTSHQCGVGSRLLQSHTTRPLTIKKQNKLNELLTASVQVEREVRADSVFFFRKKINQLDPNPDPGGKFNAYPDPKHCHCYLDCGFYHPSRRRSLKKRRDVHGTVNYYILLGEKGGVSLFYLVVSLVHLEENVGNEEVRTVDPRGNETLRGLWIGPKIIFPSRTLHRKGNFFLPFMTRQYVQNSLSVNSHEIAHNTVLSLNFLCLFLCCLAQAHIPSLCKVDQPCSLYSSEIPANMNLDYALDAKMKYGGSVRIISYTSMLSYSRPPLDYRCCTIAFVGKKILYLTFQSPCLP